MGHLENSEGGSGCGGGVLASSAPSCAQRVQTAVPGTAFKRATDKGVSHELHNERLLRSNKSCSRSLNTKFAFERQSRHCNLGRFSASLSTLNSCGEYPNVSAGICAFLPHEHSTVTNFICHNLKWYNVWIYLRQI